MSSAPSSASSSPAPANQARQSGTPVSDDNSFLISLFDDWRPRNTGRRLERVNRLLERFKIPWVVQRKLDPRWEMTTLEQRMNLWHLATQPLLAGVPGDAIELGCFQGATAAIFGIALQRYGPGRRLHLFDRFDMCFHLTGENILDRVKANFERAQLPMPELHPGDFSETVPAGLPEQIAFVHIDCGFGGPVDPHRRTVIRLLEEVYPRMPDGAVCVLMDYHPPTQPGPDYNPGVYRAAEEFFANKPEKVSSLLGGEYSHGCFRKGQAASR